jgi:long-subunit acyl-CoA synthetase (AMP-forming)
VAFADLLAAVTIGEQLMACVHKNGDALACKQKRGGQWHDISWAKYYEEIHDIAAALVSQGFQAHQCVNVLGVNSYEWSCCDLGAILVGGMAAGIYPTNSPHDCHYILNHSKAHTIFIHGQVVKGQNILVPKTCLCSLAKTCVCSYFYFCAIDFCLLGSASEAP